ncbi:MAG TPA: ABC transporter permease [Alphaproteobacteria bacterium]|nr:ABC transporter permease [Alphaproteobacteria bacterium]
MTALSTPMAGPRRRRGARYLEIGLALTLAAIAASLLGLVYTPYAPSQVDLLHRLAPPSLAHVFGTDRFGRDVLSRVLAGGWRSLVLGFGATGLGLAIGLPIALATGYYRGYLDQIVMRFIDALLSIPTLVFALLIIVGLGVGEPQAILALGIAASPKFVRIIRGAVIDAASQDYVVAAKARGERDLYIQYRELLPNVLPPIIVEGSVNIGFAVMGGAALSYLGLGTQPPHADWGVMINEAQQYISVSFWPLLGPAAAICLSIIGFNLFGEGLRDRLHLRDSLGRE